MVSQPASTDSNVSNSEPTFVGLTGKMLTNTFLVVLAAFGAFIMAYPLESAFLTEGALGWYPSLLGVSLMAFAAAALLFVNTPGTLSEKVESSRMELGSLIIITCFLLGVTFAWETETLEGVGIMGILVLLGMLLGGNILSEDRRLRGTEVRTAIAVSVVAVFFGMLAVGRDDTLHAGSILAQIFENFWKVLVAVIGFYFGGLTLEGLAARRTQNAAPPTTETPSPPASP